MTLFDPQMLDFTRVFAAGGAGSPRLNQSRGKVVKEAVILSADGSPVQPHVGIGGIIQGLQEDAGQVRVTCWDGRVLVFELGAIKFFDGKWSPWCANTVAAPGMKVYYYGRLKQIVDRNGYCLNINYQIPSLADAYNKFYQTYYGHTFDSTQFWKLQNVTDA